MELSFHPASPYVRKVLIVAHELGVADKIKCNEINPRLEASKLEPLNPLGKIPVLVTDDGTALYDSPVICEYLDTQYGSNRMLPRSGERRWEVLTVAALADGVLDAAWTIRTERLRPAEKQFEDWVGRQMQRINVSLDRLDKIVDGFASAVDLRHVGTASALDYLEFRLGGERLLDRRPRLADWIGKISERPAFQKTKPKD